MGVNPDDTTKRRGPGRKPLTDELLAKVAYYYDEAHRLGLRAHRHIEQRMREGEERLPVAQWIKKARERGFLTSTPKPGQRGGTITPKAISVLQGIGFPRLGSLRVHDLRHTAASLAISCGANIKAVQSMLGHRRAGTTLDVYGHLYVDDLEDLADRLKERLRGVA